MQKVELGSVTDIKTGRLDANSSVDDGQFPFFTCSKLPLRIDTYSFEGEYVLVAGNGDLNVKHYIGKFDAYQRTYAIKSDQSKLHTKYLYYFLSEYLEVLRNLSIGGVIKYIKIGNLTGAKIPLPPLADQQKIAAILDAADSLRQKDRQLIDHYTALSQSLFLDMFGDPVTNQMGWQKNILKTIGSVSTGNTPPRANPDYYGDHIEWIKTDNINTPNMYLTPAEEYLSSDGLKIGRSVGANSLLVTCIAGSRKVIGN